MLIRMKPINDKKYLKVTDECAKMYNDNGFVPMYYYDGIWYYKKTKDLQNFVKKNFKIVIDIM